MSDARAKRPRFCSQCGHPIVVRDAGFCKECGAPLAGVSNGPGWSPPVAAALSLLPGLGHLYKGLPGRAAAWFFCITLAYSSPPLGLMLHIICAANAAFAGQEQPARYRLFRGRRAGASWFSASRPGA